MFGKDDRKDNSTIKATGPVKTGNSEQQQDGESSIRFPNGCDQDFVYYEE